MPEVPNAEEWQQLYQKMRTEFADEENSTL